MAFVNLHLHTDNSLMDGIIKIPELVKHVKSLGQNAVAITDHGNVFGAVELYAEAKKHNINPIIGIEAYFVTSIHNKEEKRTHITLLAQNNNGLKNLFNLVTFANSDGFYYKPRIDFDALRKWNDGIICLSGCVGSLLAQLTIQNKLDEFEQNLSILREIFKDRFYFEIQDTGVQDQKAVIQHYRKIAPKKNIPIVATNDAHYLLPEDAYAQEIMVTMLQNKTLLDPVRQYGDNKSKGRYKFDGSGYYVCSEKEMLQKFTPDEVSISQHIANSCNITIDFDNFRVPKFHTEGIDSFTLLKKLCDEGWKRHRIGEYSDVEKYRNRIYYELEQIGGAGLSDYFLIVQDIIKYCNDNNIPTGPGRGSAAGCLVSYLLGITKVDPVKYGLIFERFWNPGRTKPIGYDYKELSLDKFRSIR